MEQGDECVGWVTQQCAYLLLGMAEVPRWVEMSVCPTLVMAIPGLGCVAGRSGHCRAGAGGSAWGSWGEHGRLGMFALLLMPVCGRRPGGLQDATEAVVWRGWCNCLGLQELEKAGKQAESL